MTSDFPRFGRIWCDLTESRGASLADLVAAVMQSPIDTILLRPEQLREVRLSDRVTVGCLVDVASPVSVDGAQFALSSDVDVCRAFDDRGCPCALVWTVDDATSLSAATDHVTNGPP